MNYTLHIAWEDGRHNELTFRNALEAKRHKESVEQVFKDKIIFMTIKRREQ